MFPYLHWHLPSEQALEKGGVNLARVPAQYVTDATGISWKNPQGEQIISHDIFLGNTMPLRCSVRR